MLQSCPTFDALRRRTWPSLVDTYRKLWGLVETLRQTAYFTFLTGLKIKHGQEHRRRRSILTSDIAGTHHPRMALPYPILWWLQSLWPGAIGRVEDIGTAPCCSWLGHTIRTNALGAALSEIRHFRVSVRTSWCDDSVLWLGERASWMCNLCLSVAARSK